MEPKAERATHRQDRGHQLHSSLEHDYLGGMHSLPLRRERVGHNESVILNFQTRGKHLEEESCAEEHPEKRRQPSGFAMSFAFHGSCPLTN